MNVEIGLKTVDANPLGAHDDIMFGKTTAVCFFFIYSLFLIPLTTLFSQSPESTENPVINEYSFEDYRRHPRMEEEDKHQNREFSWEPGLEIITDIDDAEIRISDETVGHTPWEKNNPASGAYNITLRKTGYVDMEFRVVLNSRKRTVVYATLKKASGHLSLLGLPPKAEIRVNHQTMEASSFEIDAGKNVLEIRAFGWEPVNESLTVAPGETIEWNFEGIRTTFYLEMTPPRPNILPPDDPKGFRLAWTASAPGRAKITVTDPQGNNVTTIPIFIDAPSGSVYWPSTSESADEDATTLSVPLMEGMYHAIIEGSGMDGVSSSDETSFRVDSRYDHRASPGKSLIPGLTYSPSTGVLPPGSFQLSTGAGISIKTDSSLLEEGIPAYFSFRVSPAERWDLCGRIGLTIRNPRENTGIDFSLSGGWRIPLHAGPFSSKIVLLFAYSGASAEFSRIPGFFGGIWLPGTSLALPMELSLGDISFILSPAGHLFFLGKDSSEYYFAGPARFAGSLGFGAYYQSRMFLIGASAAVRSPDIGAEKMDWALWSGIEGRLDFPGHASFLSTSAGFRFLDVALTVEIGLEFGIIL